MKNWPKIALVSVFCLYLPLALAISTVTPFNKGPDEGSNLNHIDFIAQKGRLSTTYEERAEIGHGANQPALYHLIVVGLSKVLDIQLDQPPHIKIFWDSFRYRALDIGAETTWFIRTEDMKWPYHGRILTLHLGRWLSILFNGLTLCLTYLLARELFPYRPWLAVTAVALLAFIPTFIFMSAVLNEDALIALTTNFYLLMLVKVIKQPRRWLPYYGFMGLAMGVSVTVKYTSVLLPLEVVAVLGLLAWSRFGWQWAAYRLAIVGLAAILASSWWFGWNIWHLNQVDSLGWAAGLARPFFTGGTDRTLQRLGYFVSGGEIGMSGLPLDESPEPFSGWLRFMILTFWAVIIGGHVPLFPYIYLFAGALIGGASWGLKRVWKDQPAQRLWILLLGGHTSLFLFLPLLRFWMSRRLGETAQGRHLLIPAAGAIAILLAWGLMTALSSRWQRWLLPLSVVILLGWSSVHLYRLATFAPAPIPLRTYPPAAAWLDQSAEVQFGHSMVLGSYELYPQPSQGLLQLNLAWRALAYTNQNLQLQIEILNTKDQIISHWQGYNGGGRVPTLAWQPNDVVFDRLALPLPNASPGEYRVRLRVVDRQGSLPVSDALGETFLHLDSFTLDRATTFSFPQRVSLNSDDTESTVDFALWQTTGPVRTSSSTPDFRYPATLAVITAPGNDQEIEVFLIDPEGQEWPSVRSQANIHAFVVGPRWASGPYRLKFERDAIGQTVTEALLTVENWRERRFVLPQIESPMTANFANEIKLLGYKLPRTPVKPGQSFPITLYWQAPEQRTPQANFIQFNHLLDEQGHLRGGYDRRPLEYYSTLLWAPGEIVVDGYAVPVDADAPPGDYYLDVGYYIVVGEAAVNLPLVRDGQRMNQSSVRLGPIEVTAP